MKQRMKNKKSSRAMILAAAALILLAGSAAGRAMAYFTTYVTSEGGKVLELGFPTTEVEEEVSAGEKRITINNTGDYDCYVRVKAFKGDQYDLTWTAGSKWQKLGEYYYWTEILQAKGSTDSKALVVKISSKETETAADSFNVIVVQECTPVPYDDNGNVIAWDKVDWNRTADVIKTETSEPLQPKMPDTDNPGEEAS